MKKVAPSPLFNKLNLGAHDEIVVFNAPDSFDSELKQLKGVKIVRDPGKPKAIKFGLAFAMTQAQAGSCVETSGRRCRGRCGALVCLPERDIQTLYLRVQS